MMYGGYLLIIIATYLNLINIIMSGNNWIQKVNASIKRRGTKGKCTPITKPGCTGRAKTLAKTFKKMAAARKRKSSMRRASSRRNMGDG